MLMLDMDGIFVQVFTLGSINCGPEPESVLVGFVYMYFDTHST